MKTRSGTLSDPTKIAALIRSLESVVVVDPSTASFTIRDELRRLLPSTEGTQ